MGAPAPDHGPAAPVRQENVLDAVGADRIIRRNGAGRRPNPVSHGAYRTVDRVTTRF